MKDRETHRIFPDAKQDIDLWDGVPDTGADPFTRPIGWPLATPILWSATNCARCGCNWNCLKPELLIRRNAASGPPSSCSAARAFPRPEDAAKARTPALADLSRFYEEARKFAYEMTLRSVQAYGREDVIITGGGPGVMEAGNLGAEQAGGVSIGVEHCAAA